MKNKIEFVYWQEGFGRIESEPYFRLPNGNHVSMTTLHENEYAIPLHPSYAYWKRMVAAKERCGKCWRKLGSERAWKLHHKVFHYLGGAK